MTAVEERREVEPEIGKSRRRKEDQHLITGATTWVDNITLPGMLHLAVLRSPMAHAKITSIDTTEAKGRPGVVAVFTGQDFKRRQGNLPCAWPVTPDMVNPGTPSIAVDQVNFVGEIVAVIAARARKAEAQDALEAIDDRVRPAAAVMNMAEASRTVRTSSTPAPSSNHVYTWTSSRVRQAPASRSRRRSTTPR